MIVRNQSWSTDRFTELLERVLRETGLSQRELAALIPVDSSQISRWKRGEARPAFDRLQNLGHALERDYPDLGIGAAQLLAAADYELSASHDEPGPQTPSDSSTGAHGSRFQEDSDFPDNFPDDPDEQRRLALEYMAKGERYIEQARRLLGERQNPAG